MDNKLQRLPPGFRFHPTDEELVLQYLRRKVFSCPLPASIISEISLGKHNPWDLLCGCEQERYFFNLREAKYANGGQRTNRATGSGYWKATGRDKTVVGSKCNRAVGAKKVLVFYQGKAPNGARTDWIMHEYRLLLDTATHHHHSGGVATATRDWVLCRVFKKKRATKMEVEVEEEEEEEAGNQSGFIDFTNQPSSPAGSELSCVTEASDDDGGQRNGEDILSLP
ncbi:NAC domain-containing protein 83-like [Iris pallida]|uniref:NAC domain-containing protein 83-like n=1 Tax=Iris pallida TaxID=29817 RepID=A0AAX6F391_IRIPA|nr:NAC domain-containing protein 83-like [Iris pallida]